VKKLRRNSIGYTLDSDGIIGLSLFKYPLEEVPLEVFKLSSLNTLYLRRNSISQIPHIIENLKDLEILDLSIND